jgi:DNA-binding response OmpR family regulator
MSTHEMGTILIVDDTPANLAFLSDALDQVGYKVLVATNGYNAINQLQLITPDLILLDVLMPGLDGFETCRRLQSRGATRNIPIVFMTALDGTDDIVRGLGLGAVDYLTKPVNHAEVLARIATRLRCSRAIRQFQEAAETGGEALIALEEHPPRGPSAEVLSAAFGLTQREAEVILWVVKGKTNRDIGLILGMSPRTVNKHLEHIYIKLGVETRTAAANKVTATLN